MSTCQWRGNMLQDGLHLYNTNDIKTLSLHWFVSLTSAHFNLPLASEGVLHLIHISQSWDSSPLAKGCVSFHMSQLVYHFSLNHVLCKVSLNLIQGAHIKPIGYWESGSAWHITGVWGALLQSVYVIKYKILKKTTTLQYAMFSCASSGFKFWHSNEFPNVS